MMPVNPAFRPQDKVQFQVAVKNLINGLPDDKMARYYDILKSAIEEDEMKEKEKMSANKQDVQAEQIVRKEVRKLLSEMFVDPNGEEDMPDAPENAWGGEGHEASFAEI